VSRRGCFRGLRRGAAGVLRGGWGVAAAGFGLARKGGSGAMLAVPPAPV